MSKENNEKVVKGIIEYANNEINKNKKKNLIILISVLASLALLAAGFFLVFIFEASVPYSDGLINVSVPADKGLDIKINLSNYKNAKTVLVKIDDNTYDLYINVTQTLATKIFDDADKSNNMLRVGNNIVVDFQSNLLRQPLPTGCSSENIMHIYYIGELSNKTMTMDDAELIAYKNKVLVWERNTLITDVEYDETYAPTDDIQPGGIITESHSSNAGPEDAINNAIIDSNLKRYYKNDDGTWQVEGQSQKYKYKLEISGRMPNAIADVSFVYLSNLDSITFEQAWKAAGYSSNTTDYFPIEDAILVGMTRG